MKIQKGETVCDNNNRFYGTYYRSDCKMWAGKIVVNKEQINLGMDKDRNICALRYDMYIVNNNLNRRTNFMVTEPPITIPNTRWIKLNNNEFTLVDEWNYEKVNQFIWSVVTNDNSTDVKYAVRHFKENGIEIRQFLHRFILGLTDPNVFVDHIDRDGLNNTENNLRTCTKSQNSMNREGKLNCSSEYKGVTFNERLNKFVACLRGKHLGCFDTEIEAAECYDFWAAYFYQNFPHFNFKYKRFNTNLNAIA